MTPFGDKAQQGDIIIFGSCAGDKKMKVTYTCYWKESKGNPFGKKSTFGSISSSGRALDTSYVASLVENISSIKVHNSSPFETRFILEDFCKQLRMYLPEDVVFDDLNKLESMIEDSSFAGQIMKSADDMTLVHTEAIEPTDEQLADESDPGTEAARSVPVAASKEPDSTQKKVDYSRQGSKKVSGKKRKSAVFKVNEHEVEEGEVSDEVIGEEDDVYDEEDSDDDYEEQDSSELVTSLLKSDKIEDIMKLVDTIDPAMAYQGFQPSLIRERFMLRNDTDEVVLRELIIIFSAYAHAGNNLRKLGSKRKSIKITSLVIKAISDMQIKKTAMKQDDITMPRLAVSFMPEYLAYRKFIAEGLQNQTSSNIAIEYKDTIFGGCPSINSLNGFADFHKEMSSYLYKPKDEISLDDKDFLKNFNRWNKIITAGYLQDTPIHARMTEIIGMKNADKRAIYKWMLEGIITYRSNHA
jgi:hypothetical protein